MKGVVRVCMRDEKGGCGHERTRCETVLSLSKRAKKFKMRSISTCFYRYRHPPLHWKGRQSQTKVLSFWRSFKSNLVTLSSISMMNTRWCEAFTHIASCARRTRMDILPGLLFIRRRRGNCMFLTHTIMNMVTYVSCTKSICHGTCRGSWAFVQNDNYSDKNVVEDRFLHTYLLSHGSKRMSLSDCSYSCQVTIIASDGTASPWMIFIYLRSFKLPCNLRYFVS